MVTKNLNEYCFFALAPNDWDGLWMNRQQLMSRVGVDSSVFYSNGLGFSWDRARILKEGKVKWAFEERDNVTIAKPPLYLMRYKKNEFADNFVIKKYANAIKSKLPKAPLILYVFHPEYVDYIKHIDYDYLVYHCYDDFISMPGSDAETKSNEYELCLLAAKERSSANRKKVGYVGSLNDKVDFSIVSYLVNSERLKLHDFHFTGRVNNLSKENQAIWDGVTNKSNVFYHESASRELVPSILKNMDVNCIYYDLSEENYSSSGYPLKLHEYLASGKPVVSSAIESVIEFSSVVLIPKNKEEWVEFIIKATSEPEFAPSNSRQRKMVAQKNDWNNRVEMIKSSIINAIESRK